MSTAASPEATPAASSYRIHIIAGNGNPKLAQDLAEALGIPLSPCEVFEHPSGEVVARPTPEVCGGDVYLVQPTCGTAELDINTAIMELLLLIRKLKLAGATRVTALVPFFGYARQDRKTKLREPLSASLVSQLIDRMGVSRVATLDLHAGQIQGCFLRVPMDNLQFANEFAAYLQARPGFNAKTTVVVSPDAGGVARAHALADLLRASHVVTIMKRRVEAGKVDSMQTVGNVVGYDCVIFDDMVDTGGTLCMACTFLKERGARSVVACITHGILTDPCATRVNECDALDRLVVSDSIPQDRNLAACRKLTVLPLAPLLANAVRCYHTEQSVGRLFEIVASSAPTPTHSGTPHTGIGRSPTMSRGSAGSFPAAPPALGAVPAAARLAASPLSASSLDM